MKLTYYLHCPARVPLHCLQLSRQNDSIQCGFRLRKQMPQLLASRLLMVQMRLFFLACPGFPENPVFHSKSSIWSIKKWNPMCMVHIPSCNTTRVCFKTFFQATLLRVSLYIVHDTQKWLFFREGIWLLYDCLHIIIQLYSNYQRMRQKITRWETRFSPFTLEKRRRLGKRAKGQGRLHRRLPHCQKQDHMICPGTIGAMYSNGIRSRNTENWD